MVGIQKVITIVISRFDPAKDDKPTLEHYQVPYTKGMRVLDAIRYVQHNFDNTLAYRWNCREGICGSCAMEVDGKPVLTCKKEITSTNILIEPMKAFPTIKDLVPDVHEVRDKFAAFVPWFTPKKESVEGFWTIKENQFHEVAEARTCIECYICYDVCHVVRNHKDLTFAGPMNFVKLVGLDRHPMDDLDRSLLLDKEGGIWNCNMTRCCTQSCPQGIKITENFITYAKERIVEENNIVLKAIRKFRSQPDAREKLKAARGEV